MQGTLAWGTKRSRLHRLRAAAAIATALAAPGAASAAAQQPSSSPFPVASCTEAERGAVVADPSPSMTPSAIAREGELTVFAAASVRDAFEAFEPAYEGATGLDLVYSFDASSFLRTQIEQGALADVFASADTVNAQTLLDAGLATDGVAFACNQLTVIVPVDNPAGIDSIHDLATPGVRVVAAADRVPITGYASRLVDDLGIAAGYAANIVSEEDNVAAVRAKIALGEGDVAIVYATDALAPEAAVLEIPIPPESNVLATYAAVAVAGTDQPDEAKAFLDWLVGSEGQTALARFGFLPAPETP